MKAVFVIDVDKDELGEAVATITTKENDITFFAKGVIRPLPQFMDEAVPYQVSETEVDCYQDPYATGFNDAIRLITGETE